MPTTNAGMAYLVSAQAQPEVTLNSDLDILDDLAFIRRGTLAARPAAARAGRLYIATDAGNEGITRDNGSSWDPVLGQGGVHLNFSGGTAPTAVAGAQAGTSPPAPVVVAGSNDVRGRCTFGTGTTPASGIMVVVTFAVPYGAAPFVFVNARSGITLNTGVYFGGSTTTTFNISFSTTPLASQGNGVYDCQWLVVGS